MIAIAILSSDPSLRGTLAQLTLDYPSFALAGTVDSPTELVRLAENQPVDLLLAGPGSTGELSDWANLSDRFALIVILDRVDEESELDAFRVGARAVLDRTAAQTTIAAAINAVAHGFTAVRRNTFHSLLGVAPLEGKLYPTDGTLQPLTRREFEVLGAMADGLSNKAIARRFGISVHTAKFHVAAILEKLGADTRTEAVTKGAQRGIVML